MKTEDRKQELIETFESEKVLNLEIIKRIIGTESRMTVFRQLKAIGYYSSYSHYGKYYTLLSTPVFDPNGLWSHGGVHFSEHGNLMETIPVLVKGSGAGFFASELEDLLHVFVHNAVGKLFSAGRLLREQIGDRYLYLSPVLAESQFLSRKRMMTQGATESGSISKPIVEHLKTFLTVLNEKQRRLCLGLESMKLGRGGDVHMASIVGVNVKTIARGRKELLAMEIDLDRIRGKGAGRPPLKKKKS